jgi:hypothetical protein
MVVIFFWEAGGFRSAGAAAAAGEIMMTLVVDYDVDLPIVALTGVRGVIHDEGYELLFAFL